MLNQDFLRIAQDQSEIAIKILPQKSAIKPNKISQLINQSAHPDFFQIEENIQRVAELINLCTQQANLAADQQTCKEKGSEVTVARRLDAKLSIEFSDDYMEAFAVVTSPFGGSIISSGDLIHVLSQHHITQKPNDDINNCLIQANNNKSGEETRFQVAAGTLPVDGEDSRFEYLVDVIENRSFRPQEAENGKVNMLEYGEIVTVKDKTILIRRHPPTEGIHGANVIGEEIAATPGILIDFSIGEGTEVSADDSNIIIANRTGIPRRIDNGLTVDDVLVVDNVDVGIGNITFEGDVVISGDVCEGMKVSSEGNITVAGFVDSATLAAQGDITIEKGIIGRQVAGEQQYSSCKITSEGSIKAKYAQYSEITAKGDINIEQQLLHCKVYSNGNVTVSNESANKGTVFGGTIIAGKKITAVELGGNCGTHTLLRIEGPLTELRTEIDQLKRALRKKALLLKQLLSNHEKVGQVKTGDEKINVKQRLRFDINKTIKIITTIKKQIRQRERAVLAFLSDASIQSVRQLNEGVRFEINGKHIVSKEIYKTTETSVIDDKLTLTPTT